MTAQHPSAGPAASAFLALFGLEGQLAVSETARWRHDLVDQFRWAGLEVRTVSIVPETVRHLSFPAILIPGTGPWVIAQQPDAASSWDEDAWEEAWAVEATGFVPASGASVLRQIVASLLFRKSLVAKVGLLGVSVAAASVVIPVAAGVVMRRALPEGATGWLAVAAAAVLLSALAAALSDWMRRRAFANLMGLALSGLQRGIIGHILRLPYLALRTKTNGEISSVQRAEDCAKGVSRAFVDMTIQGLTLTAGLGTMSLRAPLPTFGVAVATGVVGLVAWLAAEARAKLAAQRMEARQAHRSKLTEMVSGVSSLRAHDAIGQAVSAWKGLLGRDIFTVRQMGRSSATAELAFGTIEKTAWAGALLGGAWLVTRGVIDMGSAVTVLMLTSSALMAAIGMGKAWAALRVELGTLSKIDEALMASSAQPAPHLGVPCHGPITFEGVGFRYGKGLPWVVRNLNLSIQEGETVWIKSPSGRGKTTLLRLMAGLTQPTCGQACVGSQAIYGSGIPIGYLPQGATLLDDTIMENLRALSGWSTRGQILGIAEATGLDELVRRLPMGYNTRAAAGTFSGGQRQLILLTGVLAQESRILLLDEPMANMDWAMRERMGPILDNQRLVFNRTLVYVSHDVPILCANRVLTPSGEVLPPNSL